MNLDGRLGQFTFLNGIKNILLNFFNFQTVIFKKDK
jgi:hypothetical protein